MLCFIFVLALPLTPAVFSAPQSPHSLSKQVINCVWQLLTLSQGHWNVGFIKHSFNITRLTQQCQWWMISHRTRNGSFAVVGSASLHTKGTKPHPREQQFQRAGTENCPQKNGRTIERALDLTHHVPKTHPTSPKFICLKFHLREIEKALCFTLIDPRCIPRGRKHHRHRNAKWILVSAPSHWLPNKFIIMILLKY